MPGDLNQKLYVGSIPEGLKFELTSAVPTVPPGGYLSSFTGFGTLGHNTDNDGKKFNLIKFPVTVAAGPSKPGYIGQCKFTRQAIAKPPGQGGNISFSFRVTGKTNLPNKKGSITVNETGTFVVTPTDWNTFSRPDNVKLTMKLAKGATGQVETPLRNNIGMDPPDIRFIFALSEKEQPSLMLTFITNQSLMDKALGYSIEGLIKANVALIKYGVIVPLTGPVAPLVKAAVDEVPGMIDKPKSVGKELPKAGNPDNGVDRKQFPGPRKRDYGYGGYAGHSGYGYGGYDARDAYAYGMDEYNSYDYDSGSGYGYGYGYGRDFEYGGYGDYY